MNKEMGQHIGRVLEAQDKLCFALDVPTFWEAERYIDILKHEVGTFKVGLELFIAAGSQVVNLIKREPGVRCFLDLKLHDIPETVSRAVKQGKALGVDFMTVHASGGQDMVRAAVEAAGDDGPKILAVTALTSLSDNECLCIYDALRVKTVRNLMGIATTAGARGFVCSAQELSLKQEHQFQNSFFLVPGIRPAGSEKGDQKATGTPGQAIRDGADLLVVGRPIRDAKDPVKAARLIVEEIMEAMVPHPRG